LLQKKTAFRLHRNYDKKLCKPRWQGNFKVLYFEKFIY